MTQWFDLALRIRYITKPNGRRYYVAQGMYSTTTECVSCRMQLQQSGVPSDLRMVLANPQVGGVDPMMYDKVAGCTGDM